MRRTEAHDLAVSKSESCASDRDDSFKSSQDAKTPCKGVRNFRVLAIRFTDIDMYANLVRDTRRVSQTSRRSGNTHLAMKSTLALSACERDCRLAAGVTSAAIALKYVIVDGGTVKR